MDIKPRNKVEPVFSMSSIADVVFLLLIFFILTYSVVTPSGLPVNLPSSESSKIVKQKTSVTITEDLEYYVNDEEVAINDLKPALKRQFTKEGENIVVLHIDKSVPTEHLVNVADIATSLKAKVSIATKPQPNN